MPCTDLEYLIICHKTKNVITEEKIDNYSLIKTDLSLGKGYETILTANKINTNCSKYENPKTYIFKYLLNNNLISMKEYTSKNRQLNDIYFDILKDCFQDITGRYTYEELIKIIYVKCKDLKIFYKYYTEDYNLNDKPILDDEYKESTIYFRLLSSLKMIVEDINKNKHKSLYLIDDINNMMNLYNYNYKYNL